MGEGEEYKTLRKDFIMEIKCVLAFLGEKFSCRC